jgi:hypothetical protein
MLSNNPTTQPLQPDKLLDIYKDIGNNIRVTDDISFKLLGIVPLASGIGSGALTILEKSKFLEGYSGVAVAGLSALGALITLGLFRWELRNIQRCNWFMSRAANFEAQMLRTENLQFDGMVKPEHRSAKTLNEVHVSSLFETPWGKTQAEKLVYLAAIGAWLVPFVIAMYKLFGPASQGTPP